MCRYLATLVTLLTFYLSPTLALATENAFGRYVPGTFAGPASEIVPPVPGFYLQSSTFYYRASAKKNLQVPFGRTIKNKLKVEFFNTALTALWVPEWQPSENVTLGLGLTLPVQSLYVNAQAGNLGSTSDRATGIGDIMLMPAIGWHNGPHFVSFNMGIFMPTGPYNKNNLANIGLNCWTFTPSVAYTYVNPELHLDFSFAGGVDINTRNNATDYRSGAMSHADATLLRTFDNGLGLGLFGSMMYQITDDQGPLADRLDGFRGRSFAVGPMIKYSSGGEHNFTATLNWAPEFKVKNRTEGDAFYLNISLRF